MTEPKPLNLAEQQIIVAAADRWRSAPFDEHIGEMFDAVARMIAAAEQTARAEGHNEGWEKGYVVGFPDIPGVHVGRNPDADRAREEILREQRDEARRERDEAFRLAARLRAEFANARAELAEARDRVLDLEQHRVELSEQRDEAIRRSYSYIARLTTERDEARAQAVQATTDADDLRARVSEAADWLADREVTHDDGAARDAYEEAADYVRWALNTPERARTAPVSDSSASVDPSATPDLLGPQIGDSA